MNKKRILGLDLGTNSIGWAIVEIDHEKRIVRIIALGSRILPMDAGEISKFENGGKLQSSAAARSELKSTRKNISRFILRRDRLHCVLNLLEMLPEHYKLDIEFVNEKGKRSGKIKKGKEPKLAYFFDENGKSQFYFGHAYKEMESEFKTVHPELFYDRMQGKKKVQTQIPYDWTLYYLRKKGLTKELSKEELAWVTMSFLQKRGYEKVQGLDEKEQKSEELSEMVNAKVVSVEQLDENPTALNKYHIKLADEYGNLIFEYDEEGSCQITQKDEFKQVEKVSRFDNKDDDKIKSVEFVISEIKKLGIVDVVNTNERKKDKTAFEIKLSSGWSYECLSHYTPKFKGEKRDFIINSCFDEKGVLKKRNIKMPSEDDWQLEKLKIETSIENYNLKNKTCGVASYIYDALLQDPKIKIKAGLVTTIERDYYETELKKILEVQKDFHEELKDVEKYKEALWLLYPNNEVHRNSLAKHDISTLLSDDIIFYQRDLKTKKALIKDCPYEKHIFKDKETGEKKSSPIKCIAKSNPLYQEFRLWQFIKRLKIIKLETENEQKEKLVNQDVTDSVLTLAVKEELFGYLNNKKEITQEALLRHLFRRKDEYKEYKWNFEEDHKEPCNETRYDFVLRLKRIKGFDWEKFLDARAKTHEHKGKVINSSLLVDGCTNEYLLWHFFYSVKKNKERITGLPHLVEKLLINADIDLSFKDKVVEMLSSVLTYKNEYGTYSEKAIKKLLPFLRLGKYWSQKEVERIKTVDEIKPEVLEKEHIQGEIADLQGLWVSSACYIVYGRFSEVSDASRWTQPDDILDYLRNGFKQNSLNNPVVEKVLREMLLVVHDIWTTYGDVESCIIDESGEVIKTYKKYFDQINIEIGTSLKKNNKEKEFDSKRNKENRLANERAIAMLTELKSVYKNAEIKEKSPFQQEKMRILESGVIDAIRYDKDDKTYDYEVDSIEERFTKKEIKDLLKKEVSKISKKDIERYRLWLEQRYLSPYTGKPIRLSDLFDRTKYEIEHVFPQERVTINSYKNKVICETIVNKAKGAMTGYEFILNKDGKCIYQGQEVDLLKPELYVHNVKTYITDKEKQEILLSKDIPNKFGNNQLNNSRYIAKLAMSLLSNLVREEEEKEFKSKNVLVVSGGVTSILKQDWQLDETWNDLIKPRFVRMNKLLNTNDFIEDRLIEGHHVLVPTVPDGEVNKKRIDHRHHALDALIVALTTINQVNYINNVSSLDINSERKNERMDLKSKYMGSKKNSDNSKEHFFLPPMQYKQGDSIITYRYAFKGSEPQNILKYVVLEALQNTLVTFKQKNRILRQRTNKIQHPDFKFGRAEEGLNLKNKYSIRQSLHKATYYGMREIMPKSIEDAVARPEKIVNNRIKLLIKKYIEEGKTKEYIISELKKTDAVVYVREKCATTQWSHTLDYFANIKEKEEGKDKKKEKSGKSTIIREIETIADIAVQKILKKHLAKYDSVKLPIAEAVEFYDDIVNEEQKLIVDKFLKDGKDSNIQIDVFVNGRFFDDKQIIQNPQIAFSADGIKSLNDNIDYLNDGKKHKPIYKVQMIQALGKMFPVSESDQVNPLIAKNKQFVISDSGSNNYCGIYKSNEGETKIYVPSLRATIDSYRNCEDLFPGTHPDASGFYYAFTLSPLDLVYMPTEDEIEGCRIGDNIDLSRIFVVNDFNDAGVAYFRPYSFANAITEKEVDYRMDEKGRLIGSFSDKTASFEGMSIRDNCVPIKVDRLGNIIEINGRKIDD